MPKKRFLEAPGTTGRYLGGSKESLDDAGDDEEVTGGSGKVPVKAEDDKSVPGGPKEVTALFMTGTTRASMRCR